MEEKVGVDEAGDGRTRITINLSPRGKASLDRIKAVTGEGTTDAVNGALRLYALLVSAPAGSTLYLREPNMPYERIHLP